MATTSQRLTVLELVNEVMKKHLHLDAVDALGDTTMSDIVLEKLNETMVDLSDVGDWTELYRDVEVTCVSSVRTVVVDVTAEDVHHIDSVFFNGVLPELEIESKREIKRLRLSGSKWGNPLRYTIIGVSGLAPKIEMWPAPTTAAALDIGLYVKPPRYTDSDGAITPPFEAAMLIQGTYSFMLLHESGGERTPEFLAEYGRYDKLRAEANNRFNADSSGNWLQFTYTYGGRR